MPCWGACAGRRRERWRRPGEGVHGEKPCEVGASGGLRRLAAGRQKGGGGAGDMAEQMTEVSASSRPLAVVRIGACSA